MIDLFLDHLDLILEADGDAKRVRDGVLQLAIRGRLVAQDEGDEPRPECGVGVSADGFPVGWKLCDLGSLLSAVQYGFTAKANSELTGARFLRITDIQQDRVNWDSVPGCAIDQDDLEKLRLQDGDIVVARTGGTVGKSYLVDGLGTRDAVFASYLIRLTPGPSLDPQYLKGFMGSPMYWEQIGGAARGAAQPNVNSKQLRSIHFPLPPLPEQHRIVAKVDELMDHASVLEERHQAASSARVRLRDSALHALAEAEDAEAVETAWQRIETHFEDLFTEPEDIAPLRQSILQLAVRGRLVAQEAGDVPVKAPVMSKRFDPEDAWNVPWIGSKASDSWTQMPLDALGDWSSGGTPSRKNSAYYGPGTPWLKISDLNYGSVTEAEESITEAGMANSTARPIPVDAVLIAMYGSIGKCGIAGIPCSSNQAIAHCICDLDLVVPEFLLLEARVLEEILLSLGRGGAQANINQGILRHACIPIPPLLEQHRIVAKVDELMSLCDEVESRLEDAKQARERFASSVSAALVREPAVQVA